MNDLSLALPLLSTEPGRDASSLLFARYVKALALLCECEPYVDDPDYEAQLDAVLRDACAGYGLRMQRVGGRFEIALPTAHPAGGGEACTS